MRKHEASLSKQPEESREKTLADFFFGWQWPQLKQSSSRSL